MYPVKQSFVEVDNQLNALINNGHHSEALLASVFTMEKQSGEPSASARSTEVLRQSNVTKFSRTWVSTI